MHQLLKSVEIMHGVGLIHRDLKPHNIFISDFKDQPDMIPKVVIGDFGITTEIKLPTDLLFDSCGTLCYVAPEVM